MTIQRMKKSHSGFSLIELMVAVGIVGIIASIAYPSYQQYVMRSNRTEAKSALLAIQVAQEKLFLIQNAYVTSTAQMTLATNAGGLGVDAKTQNGYYDLTITAGAAPNTYIATATPASSQKPDKCGAFTIDDAGAKGFTGTTKEKCW